MDRVEAIVIGAGVVGLATARVLALSGLETLVIEKESSFGFGISSRNSEVIHAGLYYRPNSLKARLCRPGRESLYSYCVSRNIPHKQIGKWVVASRPEQVIELERIYRNALLNGCNEVYFLSKEEACEIEPALHAERVLVSPRSGIIDSHSLMTALIADIESAGGVIAYNSPVESINGTKSDHVVRVGGEEQTEVASKYLVNAAGLNAIALTKVDSRIDPMMIPEASYAKGDYFTLMGKAPFERLVYPIPSDAGLGVHLTLDMHGRARFGPDVSWVAKPHYRVDDNKRQAFAKAIADYWPGVDAQRLQPDYSGVRPKLGSRSNFSDDFLFLGPSQHGCNGLLHMLGIESPGLTCCLSIAENAAHQLLNRT